MSFLNVGLESFKLKIDHEPLLPTYIACALLVFLYCFSLLSQLRELVNDGTGEDFEHNFLSEYNVDHHRQKS